MKKIKCDAICEIFRVMYANLPREIRVHGQNVAKYACELYRLNVRAGFYRKECRKTPLEAIHIGAMYHDAGMIAVPYEIQIKESTLDTKEFIIMQNHVRFGGEIAVGLLEEPQLKYWKTVYEIATFHHELWDGSGHPNGLKETRIPLGARICAVADAYARLISDRLVRGGLNRIEALHEIRVLAGKALDPGLTKLFVQHMKQPQRQQGLGL